MASLSPRNSIVSASCGSAAFGEHAMKIYELIRAEREKALPLGKPDAKRAG